VRRKAGGRAAFLRIGAGRNLRRMSESGKSVQKAVRRRRLSAALRENLKRRKAQAKAKAKARSAVEQAAEPHDSAGIGADKRNGPLPFTSRQAGED
jgi:hypothetical protein